MTFMTNSAVTSGNCIRNLWSAGANSAACPSAVLAHALSTDTNLLLGPVPAGGATISNLEAVTNASGTAANTAKIDVMNNTTGTVVLSCTINNTSLSASACQNTGAAFVAAGSYLQVKVTLTGSGMNLQYRVSFRY